MTGKWHVQASAEKCFEVTRNASGGDAQPDARRLQPSTPGKPDPWSPYDPKFEGFWKGGKHWSEIVAEDAVYFLNEAKKHADKNPFFAYAAFNAPH